MMSTTSGTGQNALESRMRSAGCVVRPTDFKVNEEFGPFRNVFRFL